METKKQTAVEWLIKSLEKHEHDFEKGFTSLDDYIINVKWVKDQAKTLEKEQIKNAYDQMRCVGNCENGEQYYNETYKNNQ